MKKAFILTNLLAICFVYTFGQGQAETYINEALNYVKAKNYKQAQMSLQDAINELNNFTAKEVLNVLPLEVNGLKADQSEDAFNSAAMGMIGGGTTISRKYKGEKSYNTAEVSIITNSPMIASLSMFINNPALANGNNQKSIRIGTRRAMIKTETDEVYDDDGNSKKMQSFEIQLPVNQTLISLKGNGFENEAAFMAFVNKLELEKLIKTIGE